MMKNFDWSISLPLFGGVILAVGNKIGIKPFWLVLILAILLFAMFLVALVRFFKANALESENAELQKRINERESEYKRQLSSAKTDLEKQQSKFFSDISHSLRMPVSIVQGYAELLQSGTLDFTTESEYINKIIQHTYRMTDILSTVFGQGGILAAICAAPMVLGTRGYLEGKKAICYPGFEEYLKGAEVSSLPVVCDGRIITAKSAGHAWEFGYRLGCALVGRDVCEKVRESLFLPPFGC